jgi:hypothetical protein
MRVTRPWISSVGSPVHAVNDAVDHCFTVPLTRCLAMPSLSVRAQSLTFDQA